MKKLILISTVGLLFSCNPNKSCDTTESIVADSTVMNSDSTRNSSQITIDSMSAPSQIDSTSLKTDSISKR